MKGIRYIILFFISFLITDVYSQEYQIPLNSWKLTPADSAGASPEQISSLSFNDDNWIKATVPGTVFSTYVDQGLAADPVYKNDQIHTSDESQNREFWYRTVFDVPEVSSGEKVLLNFDGINWKADVWVNGNYFANISYAFNRGIFDITSFIAGERQACVAVLIYPCAHPGNVVYQKLRWGTRNGGILGRDCPTFTASQHWNWIPTVRGRNIGIYDKVYLTTCKPVKIQDPFFSSSLPLPDTSQAALSVSVSLRNYSEEPVSGTIFAQIGEIQVSRNVLIGAAETICTVFDTGGFESLIMNNPKLWWPNGYGNQHLYKLKLWFTGSNGLSDSVSLNVGIRQFSYDITTKKFALSCNGVPVMILGGNWGMPELMLRATGEKYDQWVRMHKEMNFNMIRNWVGQTPHDAFYDACDKYGILIMDDFWLANPVDGPNPDSVSHFLYCARDKVKRLRNHPSLAFYCGRNEGNPDDPASGSPGIPGMSDSLENITNELDGTRCYIPNSAGDPLSGLGPYELKQPSWYFKNKGTGTLHSEIGVVAPMVYESMELALGKENLWPINDMWGVHDWTQPRDDTFAVQLRRFYGAPAGIHDFTKKSQCLIYQGIQALYESYQVGRGSGVLLWMSHPAWTSLKCQLYDYFGDYTGGFFAARHACEPVHVLWKTTDNTVYIANNLSKPMSDAKVEIFVYNMDGEQKYYNTVITDAASFQSVKVFEIPFSQLHLSNVHFIRLKLFDSEDQLISENFYWRGNISLDFKDLNKLTEPQLSIIPKEDGYYSVTNTGSNTAFFIRLKMVDEDGNRILPVYYSDNYFTLFPGESKVLKVESGKPGTLIAEPFTGEIIHSGNENVSTGTPHVSVEKKKEFSDDIRLTKY